MEPRFKHTEDPATFFSLVGPEGCLEWQGAKDKDGYGQTRIGKRRIAAHRKVWILLYGEIPDGMDVLHHCDNPPCCRPNHLFLGTKADNVHDRVAKGRSNGGGRLTEDRVRELRSLYATGTVSQLELSIRFGVNQAHVSKIIRRTVWANVT